MAEREERLRSALDVEARARAEGAAREAMLEAEAGQLALRIGLFQRSATADGLAQSLAGGRGGRDHILHKSLRREEVPATSCCGCDFRSRSARPCERRRGSRRVAAVDALKSLISRVVWRRRHASRCGHGCTSSTRMHEQAASSRTSAPLQCASAALQKRLEKEMAPTAYQCIAPRRDREAAPPHRGAVSVQCLCAVSVTRHSSQRLGCENQTDH